MLLETKSIEFGDFRLDVDEKQLFRNDEPISLTPKAFKLLLKLVERHGHVVEKDEIMQRVWADSFVEESNLTFTISMLRKALVDDASSPKYIETIPKRGYRFVADVHMGGSNGSNAFANGANNKVALQADLEPVAEGVSKVVDVSTNEIVRPGSKKRLAFGFAALILAVVALGSVIFFGVAGPSTSVIDNKRSIAVMPVKSIDPALRDEIYEVGIADSLILRINGVKGLVVRPLSATRRYAEMDRDPVAAGREQEVDYVLSSNYQLSDRRIRITSQLIKVANSEIEKTFKTEESIDDIFAVQDSIANQIGNLLMTYFAAAATSQKVLRGTKNEEAYRLYLQGIYLYNLRTPKASKKAVELLEEAVRLDPNFALAWAGKAHAHRYRGNLGRDTDTNYEYQRSIGSLNEALLLDKDLSEAHSALCENKYYFEWDFGGAEIACQKAITLDPNSSMAHEIYGRYLLHRGRFSEAIGELENAINLDPASLLNQRSLGMALYYSGRYDEAEAHLKKVIATDKNFTSAYLWLRNSLEMQGKYADAFDTIIQVQTALGVEDAKIQRYQTAFQTGGYKAVVEEQVARFEEGNNQFYVGAVLSAQVGDKEKAFEYLKRSFERREWGMNSLLVEPHLNVLRDDSRFEDLVRRVGLR